MKYKCIIFDCDGVLVDSEAISNQVLIDMVKELGFKIEKSYADEFFSGVSLKSIFQYVEVKINKKLPIYFEEEYRKRTFDLFKTDLKPIKGINDILDKISIPVCVASSGPMEKIILNLTTTNLLTRFDKNIFSSYDINSWKPNPDIFLYAAKKMGFLPNECLVIEDSIAGIKAAKKGGFDVCGFANMNNNQLFEKEGAFVITEMKELISILRGD